MKKRRVICVALIGLASALVVGTLLLYDHAQADVLVGPLPAPGLPQTSELSLRRIQSRGALL
jgi:hypothetical protein